VQALLAISRIPDIGGWKTFGGAIKLVRIAKVAILGGFYAILRVDIGRRAKKAQLRGVESWDFKIDTLTES